MRMRTADAHSIHETLRRAQGVSWSRLRMTLAVFALLFCAVEGAFGGSQSATVSYSQEFPNSSPESFSIVVNSDGHATYQSSGKIATDSDERTNYQTDFTVSDVTSARIFELAARAHYFSGKIDSGNKKLAFTGQKKLTFTDGQRNS